MGLAEDKSVSTFAQGGAPLPTDRRPSVFEGTMLLMLSMLLLTVLPGISQSALSAALVGETLAVLLPVLIFLRAERVDLRVSLRLHPVPAWGLAVSLLAGAAMWVPATTLASAVAYLYSLAGRMPPAQLPPLATPLDLVKSILVVGALVALAEESLFRGFLYRAYEPAGGPAAVALTALFFAFFHPSAVSFAPALLSGLVAGWLSYRFNSLWAAVSAHFANNTTALVTGYVMGEGASGTPTAGELGWLLLASVGAGAVLAGCLWLARRYTVSGAAHSRSQSPQDRRWAGVVGEQLRLTFSRWPARVVLFLFLLNSALEILYVLGLFKLGD